MWIVRIDHPEQSAYPATMPQKSVPSVASAAQGNIVPALIPAELLRPSVFPHPVGRLEVLETHISWIILTGPVCIQNKEKRRFGLHRHLDPVEAATPVRRGTTTQSAPCPRPICGRCRHHPGCHGSAGRRARRDHRVCRADEGIRCIRGIVGAAGTRRCERAGDRGFGGGHCRLPRERSTSAVQPSII